jgi:hypothetical protein
VLPATLFAYGPAGLCVHEPACFDEHGGDGFNAGMQLVSIHARTGIRDNQG